MSRRFVSLLSGALLLASAAQAVAADRDGATPTPAKKMAAPAAVGAPQAMVASTSPGKGPGVAASTSQCTWLGKRVLLLLAREDVVAAGDFSRFYVWFGCPDDHISKAFGCLMAAEVPVVDMRKALDSQASPEARKAAETVAAEAKKAVGHRADQCWTDTNAPAPERKEAASAAQPAAPPAPSPAAATTAPAPVTTPAPSAPHPAPAAAGMQGK
ncbi:MAG: hypothetical protein H7841_04100 [Magnetospirillum sp. WYHS-4]